MSGSVAYEKKDVNVKVVGFSAALIVLLIWIFVIVLDDYFVFNVEKMEKINAKPNPELQVIHRTEQKALNGYAILDKDKKIYKIPVDQAMKMVVREYAH